MVLGLETFSSTKKLFVWSRQMFFSDVSVHLQDTRRFEGTSFDSEKEGIQNYLKNNLTTFDVL